jgi:glycosyltransferase involved in cell wall biosynthesis
VLVDNGLKDKSTLSLEEKYPTLNLSVEYLESNRGFAAANNIGARGARHMASIAQC